MSFCLPFLPPSFLSPLAAAVVFRGCRNDIKRLPQSLKTVAAVLWDDCATRSLLFQGSPKCSTMHSTWRGVKLLTPG